MSIKFVILGLLSETPLTGYDLKKKFLESDIFHWSGNNNQIYRTLSELHQENLVTIETQYQENKPPRKIHTITESGLEALRKWMLSAPELPQFRSVLLTQLMWADQVDPYEVGKLLAQYEEELQMHLAMLREKLRRNIHNSQSKAIISGNISLRDRIAEHWISYYQHELNWVNALRDELEGE